MTAPALEASWRNVLIAGTLLLLLVAASVGAKICLAAGMAWPCPVITLLSVPCPSCGSTRALAALGELRLLSALSFNPLLVLAFPVGALALRYRDRLARSPWAWPMFFTVVFLNWVYLVLFLPR